MYTATSSRCRQVGVSLVRGLGLAFHVLALPLRRIPIRQAATEADAARALHAPQRPIPAYEWNFGDVNPPVHALVHIFTYRLEKARTARATRIGSRSNFQKLLLTSPGGSTARIATGATSSRALPCLDNIGVFDRSAPLPTAATSNRRTAPRGCTVLPELVEIAAELSLTDPDYLDMVLKFVEPSSDRVLDDATWATIRACGTRRTASSYDVLRLPNGQSQRPQGSLDGSVFCPCAQPPRSKDK